MEEVFTVGVVGGAHVVVTKGFHEAQTFFDGAGKCGSSERTEGVVVGKAFEKDFLAVEQKATFG